MKDNVILEVKNVEKFFYGNKKLFQKDRPVVKAVNDVSFTINEGETSGTGMAESSAFVYGCIGLSYNSCLSAISTIRPKYITPMRSHKKRTTLKSWEMNI